MPRVSCSGTYGTNSVAKTLNTDPLAAGGRSVVVLAASWRLSSKIPLSLAATAFSNYLASKQLARHKSFTRVFRLATLVLRLLARSAKHSQLGLAPTLGPGQ